MPIFTFIRHIRSYMEKLTKWRQIYEQMSLTLNTSKMCVSKITCYEQKKFQDVIT